MPENKVLASKMTCADRLTSKQNLRVWLKVLKTTKHIEAMIREKLRDEFDTTLPRFDVMSALYRFDEGLRMSELSAALRVSNGNVTGIIERLVSDGLVIRETVSGDKRATIVRLTKTGKASFETLADAHEKWIDDVLQVLEPEQSAALLTIMDEIDHSRGFTEG
ncbi:DNA-binding MarR family transcriptional regulator [Paenochrobactrum gallinarii]|uniref:DNA-binding MarR family transcriptional regulator n=1 Tax=Paenochrobactrum gallinarii TaxID=643673 RepID=A0A841M0V8_9HYPH|nr:MarR family transcriptional regulator [Paenochrobactrum gallinarii]MBB6261469.1 DNA-binding MarR family transcriptional regulator [Paenochrobactrum gallinarii]